MDVAHLMDVASDWWPTAMLAGLVLGFLVAMGRPSSPPAGWPDDRATMTWAGALRAALAGLSRLQELHHRRALPPWDDLDDHFPVDRRPLTPDPNGGPRDG